MIDYINKLYGGTIPIGLMRVAHHLLLAIHDSTGEVGLGVKESAELVVSAHENLMIAVYEQIVEDDRSEEDEVYYCYLEVNLLIR